MQDKHLQQQSPARRRSQLQDFVEKYFRDYNNTSEPSDPTRMSQSLLIYLDEALTHSSANEHQNHEKLEFLGDAALRLAASEFIDQAFPEMNVGERSMLRGYLVSDQFLASVGADIDILDVVVLGKQACYDENAYNTFRAECTEALIGALYLHHHSTEKIHTFLKNYWNETAIEILKNPKQYNSKSALQEWSQAQNLGLPDYHTEEQSKQHGDPRRFHSQVRLGDQLKAKGWGRSRKEAEQRAAQAALQELDEL